MARWVCSCRAAGSTEADFRGERFADHPHDLKGHDGVLVLSRPDVIEAVHREYLDAGADLITTATFNGSVDLAGRLRARADRATS